MGIPKPPNIRLATPDSAPDAPASSPPPRRPATPTTRAGLTNASPYQVWSSRLPRVQRGGVSRSARGEFANEEFACPVDAVLVRRLLRAERWHRRRTVVQSRRSGNWRSLLPARRERRL